MKLIRFGLCVLFVFAVLAYGAVEVWSQSILETGAGFLFAVWAVMFLMLLLASPMTPVMFFNMPKRSSQKTVSFTG